MMKNEIVYDRIKKREKREFWSDWRGSFRVHKKIKDFSFIISQGNNGYFIPSRPDLK